MPWPFSPDRKENNISDNYHIEMCDICGRTYNYLYIRRFQYFSKRGTPYIVRCCPNCNIQTFINMVDPEPSKVPDSKKLIS